jgi:hypothetical protein
MYENERKFTPEQGIRAPTDSVTGTRNDSVSRGVTDAPSTDPKFVRESNTMRTMQPWQIAALAIAAVVVAALILFYI